MRRQFCVVMLAMVVVAGLDGAPAFGQDGRERFPSIEGAWIGTVSIVGFGETPSMDTFTSNALTLGLAGTFLCTMPTPYYPNPENPGDPTLWVTATPAGHGNWKRTGRNEYSYTAMRVLTNQAGAVVGTASFWGLIRPVSADEYEGTMNAQFHRPDGTLLYPPEFGFPDTFTGTLSSKRIAIIRQ